MFLATVVRPVGSVVGQMLVMEVVVGPAVELLAVASHLNAAADAALDLVDQPVEAVVVRRHHEAALVVLVEVECHGRHLLEPLAVAELVALLVIAGPVVPNPVDLQ